MGSSTAQYPLTGRWVRSRQVTHSDTGTTVAVLDVPAHTLIPAYGVVMVITTLCAGGTESLDVGDGSDGDGWIDSTDITEVGTGTFTGTEANTGAYAVAGKYYSAADTIDVAVSASMTAGEAYVFAYMIDVSDIIDD